jgi:hypothetical protein
MVPELRKRGPNTPLQSIGIRPEWEDLKNIQNILWVSPSFLNTECGVERQERLKKVENRWKKCFHFGTNLAEADTKTNPLSDYKVEILDKKERNFTPSN